MYILFPGRHHLLTNFQYEYLKRLIDSQCEGEIDVNGNPLPKDVIEGVVYAGDFPRITRIQEETLCHFI